MNFFLIILFLRIYLNKCSSLSSTECKSGHLNFLGVLHEKYLNGICTNIDCEDDAIPKGKNCSNGTTSKVLRWESDIFEFGVYLSQIPRNITVEIALNKDYYLQIEVSWSNENKEQMNLTTKLKECSYKSENGENCIENENLTEFHENTYVKHHLFLAIGFRKDKKINYATTSGAYYYVASNEFSPENVYEFKMTGFYFNTNDTMNIQFKSEYDAKFEYDGFFVYLPYTAGGFFFDYNNGFFIRGEMCRGLYKGGNDKLGLKYIIKEYFENNEDWIVQHVLDKINGLILQKSDFKPLYFDESGMLVNQTQMRIVKRKNPYFDENFLFRSGCEYINKSATQKTTKLTETTKITEKTELTKTPKITETTDLTETPEMTETTELTETPKITETTKLTETSKITKITKLIETPKITETIKLRETSELPEISAFTEDYQANPDHFNFQIPGPEKDQRGRDIIKIGNKTYKLKTDPLEPDMNLADVLKDLAPFMLKGSKNDGYLITLPNNTKVNLKDYKDATPNDKKSSKNKGNKNKTDFGGGGGGDTSRGQTQTKIISMIYILVSVLIILSFQTVFN